MGISKYVAVSSFCNKGEKGVAIGCGKLLARKFDPFRGISGHDFQNFRSKGNYYAQDEQRHHRVSFYLL